MFIRQYNIFEPVKTWTYQRNGSGPHWEMFHWPLHIQMALTDCPSTGRGGVHWLWSARWVPAHSFHYRREWPPWNTVHKSTPSYNLMFRPPMTGWARQNDKRNLSGVEKKGAVTFTIALQNVVPEIQSFQQKSVRSGVWREAENFPMQLPLVFKFVT